MDRPILHASGLRSDCDEEEMMTLLGSLDCLPARAKLQRSFASSHAPASGTIEFRDLAKAEKAYALVQKVSLSDGSVLSLKIAEQGGDPLPTAKPRQIKGFSSSTTTRSLYDLCRPFGRIYRCSLMQSPDVFAVVEFFEEADAIKATSELHCSTFDDATLTIQVHRPSAVKPRGSLGLQSTPTRPLSYAHSHESPAIENGELIDRCNLVIQNLGKSISSRDLFQAFKSFGRIISARHMTDADGTLRGFGFVSFQSELSAVNALKAMNGSRLRSFETGEERVVTIAYHRLKKPVKAERTNSVDSDMARHMNGLVVDPSGASTPMLRQVSSSSTASSVDSPVDSPDRPKSEKERLIAGVSRLESDHKMAELIVDLLSTLPKAERAMCLFNPDTMAKKVVEAKEVILSMEESPEPLPTLQERKTDSAPNMLEALAALPPSQILKLINEGLMLQGVAIVDAQSKEEVDKLVDSVKDKSVTDQKQAIGERIFRVLKSGGMKGAPKRAIALLDGTDDLRSLAHLMTQPEVLRLKAQAVSV